jgi:hypothetical protein
MLMFELKDMVPDYNPSAELLHQVIDPNLNRLATAVHAAQAVVPVADLSPVAGI